MKILVSLPRGSVFDTFFPPEVIRLTESLAEVMWNDTAKQFTAEELKERLRGCDAYVAGWGAPALTEQALEGADRLKLLVVLGSTVAPYVSQAMWERGIRVISGFDDFSRSTAEGAVAYMLAAQRNIPFYTHRLTADRIWKAPDDYTGGLLYKSVGIISYGSVARHVVRMLGGFDVDLRVFDIVEIPREEQEKHHFRQCGIEEIFSECDIISVHTPYNDATHHMIDDRLLSMIKKGALLVNTARGGVVDQAALTRHLQNGDFRVALDVYEKEPIATDDPLLDLDPRAALLIPHMGGPTVNLRARIARELLTEAHGYLERGLALKSEIDRERAASMSKH